MKNNVLLPRKDHEVYFLPLPTQLKGEKLRQFVAGKLPELHPGFSAAQVFDIQNITFDDSRRWIMITVMKQETLTEYRIMYPRSLLYTTTALLVHLPGFTGHPMYCFPAETIGYAQDKNEPVSFPQPDAAAPVPGEFITDLVLHAPAHYSVFRKRKAPLILLVPVFVCIAAFCAFAVYSYRSAVKPQEIKPLPASTVVPEITIQAVPGPFAMFAAIADTILKTGGAILQWQYNENAVPAFTVNISGADTGELFDKLRPLEYVLLDTVSDIQYRNGEPAYTLSLSFNTALYAIPVHTAFTDQEEGLSMLAAVRTVLTGSHAQIVSETPPSAGNGHRACSVAFTCGVGYFVTALDKMELLLAGKTARIETLNVSFDRQKNLFISSCSFSKIQEYDNPTALPPAGKDAIPLAFGYKKPTPVSAPVFVVKPETSGLTRIGVIQDEDNQIVTYYRTAEGKIIPQKEIR